MGEDILNLFWEIKVLEFKLSLIIIGIIAVGFLLFIFYDIYMRGKK
jgi:hypothetical protein